MRFFGARGDDQFGEFIGGALADEGVDVSSLRVIAGMHSGVALIAVDAQAENQILALPGANGAGRRRRAPAARRSGSAPARSRARPHEGTLAAARADGAAAVVNPSPANAIDAEVVARSTSRSSTRPSSTRSQGTCPRASCSRAARRGAVLLPEGTELPAVPAQRGRHDRVRAMPSPAACAPASRRARRSSRRCSSRS